MIEIDIEIKIEIETEMTIEMKIEVDIESLCRNWKIWATRRRIITKTRRT